MLTPIKWASIGELGAPTFGLSSDYPPVVRTEEYCTLIRSSLESLIPRQHNIGFCMPKFQCLLSRWRTEIAMEGTFRGDTWRWLCASRYGFLIMSAWAPSCPFATRIRSPSELFRIVACPNSLPSRFHGARLSVPHGRALSCVRKSCCLSLSVQHHGEHGPRCESPRWTTRLPGSNRRARSGGATVPGGNTGWWARAEEESSAAGRHVEIDASAPISRSV